MRDNQTPLFSAFDALVFGALLGAAAGLMLAPHEGKKTRKLVQKKVNEWAEQGQSAFQDFKEQNIDPAMEDFMNKAEDFKDDVQTKVEDAKDQAEDFVSNAQDEIENKLTGKSTKSKSKS